MGNSSELVLRIRSAARNVSISKLTLVRFAVVVGGGPVFFRRGTDFCPIDDGRRRSYVSKLPAKHDSHYDYDRGGYP